jgi:tRNA (guanine-N7-)-methyltransferase
MGAPEAKGAAVSTATNSAAAVRLQAMGAAGRVKWMTTKREFRARAHSNPLNDGIFNSPLSPACFAANILPSLLGRTAQRDQQTAASDDTSTAVNASDIPLTVHWCDMGCGYGGLLASLSVAFPDKTMLGLEIRERVAEFCLERIKELRREYRTSDRAAAGSIRPYTNIGFVRTNGMKYLCSYFPKGSLEKLFFCYPDPHFKRRRHRQRVISDQLLAEYAYVLKPGLGVAYIVSDVPELFEWMDERLERCPLFRRRTAEEIADDPVVAFVRDMTDEAARVDKSTRGKQDSSFVRIESPHCVR